MRGYRARQLVLTVLALGLAVAGAVAVPSSAGASATNTTSASSPYTPSSAPSRAGLSGISGRPVPETAAPPERSCGRPALGQFACQAVRRGLEFAPMAGGGAPYGLSPADLQSAYSLPGAAAGSGQTVWIVDAYDDPTAESDLAVYRAQYGLPPCTTANGCFRKLNQSGVAGNYPAADPGWAGEIALDLAMVSAVCPNCAIRLIEADDAGAGLFTAVDTAVSLGAKFVSLSWGANESSGMSSYDRYFDTPGVVFTAASGDNAYAAGVIYPSSSPYVVSVGGTALRKAATARGWSETAWSLSGGTGAGSGCSSVGIRPAWQTVPSTSVCTRRVTSDVSAVADPATGVAVYQTYGGSGWAVFGGTSAAAPIIASVYALAGTPGPNDSPPAFPYQRPDGLHDITSGSTGTCSPPVLCTSGAGWDGPTGLGSPNGVASFAAVPPVVSVTNPGRQTGRVGTAAALTLQGTDVDSLPLTWSAVGLPPGLQIAPATGAVTGTPTAFGSFTVTVTATDPNGATGSAGFVWAVASDDVTPPTASMTRPSAAVTPSTKVTVAWTGSDAYTGVAYYQVRVAKARYDGGFGTAVVPSTWTHLTTTSLVHGSLSKGYTYCYSVRAVDRAGNVSAWSAQRCTAVPLDDRSLTTSAGWSRGTGSAYWSGTVTPSSTRGSSLSRSGAQVSRVAVVATRCVTCGVVGVYVGGTLVGRVDLHGALGYRVLFPLPKFSYRTGTVTLRVLSSGKRVSIDAVALSRV